MLKIDQFFEENKIIFFALAAICEFTPLLYLYCEKYATLLKLMSKNKTDSGVSSQ